MYLQEMCWELKMHIWHRHSSCQAERPNASCVQVSITHTIRVSINRSSCDCDAARM